MHSFKNSFSGVQALLAYPVRTIISYEYSSTAAVSYAVSLLALQWYHTRPLCEVLPIMMGDFTNDSGNFITNAIKELNTFDGRTPATL